MSERLVRMPHLAAMPRSFAPPTTIGIASFIWPAALLVGLLVGVVPLVSLATDLPPLALAVAAGVVYTLMILVTQTGFEGLASAVVVLSVFDLGVTLVRGPGEIPVSSLSLMAVDLVAVPLLIVFLYYMGSRFARARAGFNGRTIAVAALGLFVLWTVASGIVANGQSNLAPLLEIVQYARYGLLFVLAALIVRSTNPWCVVYPLTIAIGGNLAFALAQVMNSGGFGLKALGETPTVILGTFALAGSEIPFGSYAGGFVGHSREFTIILLLFVPLLVAITARRSWSSRLFGVAGVLAAVLVIRTADTDAGWAALLLVGVLLAGTLGYATLRDRHRGAAVGVLATGIGGAVAAVALALVVVASASANAAPAIPIPLFDTRTLSVRIEQYVVAFDVARTYPLFGLGTGNFFLAIESYGLPDFRGIHGIVFSYLAATGFVGATAYVLGVTAVLGVGVRRFLRETGREQLLWGALVCGMVGFHAYSLWDLAHLWDAALSILWVLMGVVVGTGIETEAESGSTSSSL